jgi:hypothetical protein
MTTQQITCDECGEVKKETNNWLKLWVCYSHKLFSNVGFPEFARGENQPDPNRFRVLDLCGQECLHNTISKIIGQNHE